MMSADPLICSDGQVRRRLDIAEFLQARRAHLQPADVGLSPGVRRRTKGLRREEVALLAGVSVSWYTWLEQGRQVNVSVDVLDSLARALRLDAVEHAHLLGLAGHYNRWPLGGAPDHDGNEVPAAVLRVLDALDPCPAYLLGPRWDLLARNEAHRRLYPSLDDLRAEDRNLVHIVFTRPEVRAVIDGWEDEARRILSQFRADTVPHRDDPEVVALVARLHQESDEFAEWWPRHDVAGFDPHRRSFVHPQAGPLLFELSQLVPAASPDLRIVALVGLPGDDSVQRLTTLTHPTGSVSYDPGRE